MASRPFLPVDVSFMDDDKVIEAGPAAAWCFLAMMLACKRHGTDGTITRPQMTRLGVDKWAKHVETLISVGLVMDVSDDENARKVLWIPSWSKWNLLAHEREEKRQKAKSAAQKRWGTHSTTHAERIAQRNAHADAKKRREEKRYDDTDTDSLMAVDEVLKRMRTW